MPSLLKMCLNSYQSVNVFDPVWNFSIITKPLKLRNKVFTVYCHLKNSIFALVGFHPGFHGSYRPMTDGT